MSNVPITNAADELYALLAVIADPAAARTRLDELVAQQKATQERIDALNEMAAETRRLNTTAQATDIVLNNRKAALDAREAEIVERAKNLDLSAADLNRTAQAAEQKLRAREADIARREAAVEQRETAIKEMEAEAKTNAEQAASLKERLQRQAAAVQVAMTQ